MASPPYLVTAGVGASERVDAVVVAPVRKGSELVEEGVRVATTDELDESVLSGCGDRDCAGELVAGDANWGTRYSRLRTWRL